MGPFTASPTNPVITGSSLWGQICDNPNDHCYQLAPPPDGVRDEGTFDILEPKQNGYYYVSFHGYVYSGPGKGQGVRGLAKTPDFITWIAGNQNGIDQVPNDAIVDQFDTQSWRETWSGPPVGVGAGRILQENGSYYQIVEGMDMDLTCVAGQHWDWGMFRSSDLSSSIWTQLPKGNPFIYTSASLHPTDGKTLACNPAYAGIMKDTTTGKYYLHYTRESFDLTHAGGIMIFELVPTKNLLQNSNAWTCTTDNWHTISPSNSNTILSVQRETEKSSDDNCYFQLSCGASTCTPGQSLYQDVSIAGKGITNVSIGGKIMNEGAGTATITLFELDSNGNPLANQPPHTIPVAATTSYQSFASTATLSPATHTLRFQVYLNSPQTFRLDELFVEPTAAPTNTPSPIPGDINSDGHISIVDIRTLLSRSPLDIFLYTVIVKHYGQ